VVGRGLWREGDRRQSEIAVSVPSAGCSPSSSTIS
jgi:hypothetical protein